jgi:carbamate kinase
VQATRQPAAIGALSAATSIVDGTAGTTVVADRSSVPA